MVCQPGPDLLEHQQERPPAPLPLARWKIDSLSPGDERHIYTCFSGIGKMVREGFTDLLHVLLFGFQMS